MRNRVIDNLNIYHILFTEFCRLLYRLTHIGGFG